MMMAAVATMTVTRAICFHDKDGRGGNDDSDADANVDASRLPP